LMAQLISSLAMVTGWSFQNFQPGWMMLLIVEVPVLLLILAAIFGRPRKPKVTIVFVGTLLVLFTGFVATTWLLGTIVSVFFP
jgi:hypothetical protein